MAYSKWLSSKQPGLVVLLIDQSGSMGARYHGSGDSSSKAEFCARAVNRTLYELAMKCTDGDELKDRCDICCIGYGLNVGPAFGQPLDQSAWVTLSELANNPIEVTTLLQRVPDGAGGLVEVETPYPVWVRPVHGGGTPMAEAMELAVNVISQWIAANPDSFPPIVINITDGEPNDGQAVAYAAKSLQSLATSDGHALLLNAHIPDGGSRAQVLFPMPGQPLHDQYADFLSQISSPLPAPLADAAAQSGFNVQPGAAGLVFNADADVLVRLLTFGTQGTLGRNVSGDGTR